MNRQCTWNTEFLVGDYYGSCWVRMVAPDSSLSSAIATGKLHACKVTRDSGSPLPTQTPRCGKPASSSSIWAVGGLHRHQSWQPWHCQGLCLKRAPHHAERFHSKPFAWPYLWSSALHIFIRLGGVKSTCSNTFKIFLSLHSYGGKRGTLSLDRNQEPYCEAMPLSRADPPHDHQGTYSGHAPQPQGIAKVLRKYFKMGITSSKLLPFPVLFNCKHSFHFLLFISLVPRLLSWIGKKY